MLTKNWKKRGMKNIVILVDTNIIVDAVAERHPFAVYANIIIEKCARREVTGFLAAHSISNLFYILRKNFPWRDAPLPFPPCGKIKCLCFERNPVALRYRI